MSAETDLLPLPEGDAAWYYIGSTHVYSADEMESYARANVANAVAPLQAEIEALRAQLDEQCRLHAIGMERELALITERDRLRAEVERLRALAGCAYQMAGMHDAPLVWLDRLSEAANGDALPDVDTLMGELLPYQPDVVCEAEARADKLRAEVEMLRDAFSDEDMTAGAHWFGRYVEQKRSAERLAEALRDAATSMQAIADKAGRDEYLMTTDEVRCYANSRANAARAALEQEEGK